MSLKERLGLQAEPVFLMDGSAFIFRGFFANRNMQRSDGFPTNALVVVSRVLLRILRNEQPRYFAFIQDGKGPNFRHERYPAYKANRDATPEELVKQFDPIRRMVTALGLKLEISQGCEADDCIASLAARFRAEHPVIIISGDKDLKQCLGPNVYMWDPAAKEEKLLDLNGFIEENNIDPAHWPDVQALIGDSSDNIPGVPGIGPKTARQIFDICPSLEDIRDHFALLPPKIQKKLQDHLENMFLWRELTRLSLSQCQNISLAELQVQPPDRQTCLDLTKEFELFALRRDLDAVLRGAPPQESNAPELPLRQNTAAPVQRTTPAPVEAGRSRATTQGSLLDAGSTMEQEYPCAPEVRSTEDLPSCQHCSAALFWPSEPGKQPRLAVAPPSGDIQEYTWLGRMEDLCRWLQDAASLCVVDLKILLRTPWGKLLHHPQRPCFDLSLAAYLLNPEEGDYTWTRLAHRYGDSLAAESSAGPAAYCLKMMPVLRERLEREELLDLYQRLEQPLTPVLADMEERGIAIDAAAFQSFLNDVQNELDTLTARVHAAAGKEFNIRSAQQLGEVLFQELQLPAPKKTRGGQASTSQQTLEKLAGKHPVVDSILQFRKLEKMRSTYLDPLPRLVDNQGRLHTTFNQMATATGRLSSRNPNLQNIPVRGPLGKRMRACFIAGPGHLLISADYSQVELRVLAHMSQDKTLIEAFQHGADIHARTAALIYDVEQEAVSSDQRRNAKTINFGLIYGMGAQKLGQELKISLTEAKAFIARYFERLTGLKEFYEKVEADAKQHGYVTTLGGRRRLLPDIFSANGQAFALARRQAINTVIQGSAADIIKIAMLTVAQDKLLTELGARLLLQVHDELLLEVPEERAQEAGARVAALMTDVQPADTALSVPLVVDWGQGKDWGTAH